MQEEKFIAPVMHAILFVKGGAMSYKNMDCPICGLTYHGWHTSRCCKRAGCQRLMSQVKRRRCYLQYEKPRKQAQPKTCRKCGSVVPKGKQLCSGCRRHRYYTCGSCGKLKKRKGREVFCRACWRKLGKNEGLQQLLTIIAKYESMLPSMNMMMDELQEKNAEYREKIALLESQLAKQEVTNAEPNQRGVQRRGQIYPASHELGKHFNIGDF